MSKTDESRGYVTAAIIGGVFLLITAFISGLFLLISTGKIDNPFERIPNATEAGASVDSIIGTWAGVEQVIWKDTKQEPWVGDIIVRISDSCKVGSPCGSLDFPTAQCSVALSLSTIEGNTFRFQRDIVTGDGCDPKAEDSLHVLADGTLLYFGKGDWGEGRAVLQKTEN